MEKFYQIKTYGFDGTYKDTISPILFMQEISFSSQINGGQGECRLKLNLPIDTARFEASDIIQITCFDEDNIAGRIIYTGMLTRFRRTLQSNGEFIELTAIGLFSVMKNILFYSASYAFTKNQDPAQTIKDVVDYFNSIYTADWFSYTGVDTYGASISIDFDYDSCLDSINKIQRITSDRFYFVGPDGNFKFKDTAGTLKNHKLKIENQVDNMYIDEEIESVLNKVFVEYDGTVAGPYEDATSQSAYGIREAKQYASGISDAGGANIFGNAFIDSNKNKKKQISITVNSKYDLEDIQPGDTVTILNSTYNLPTMLINKISYSQDKVILYLEKYETFAGSVLSNNL